MNLGATFDPLKPQSQAATSKLAGNRFNHRNGAVGYSTIVNSRCNDKQKGKRMELKSRIGRNPPHTDRVSREACRPLATTPRQSFQALPPWALALL